MDLELVYDNPTARRRTANGRFVKGSTRTRSTRRSPARSTAAPARRRRRAAVTTTRRRIRRNPAGGIGNLLNNAAGGAVGFAGSTFLAGLLKSKLPLPAAVPPQVAQAVLAAVVGFGLDVGLKKFAPKMRTAAQVGSALAVVAPLARQFNVPGFAGLGADDLTEADLALLDIPLQGLGAGNWGYPLLGAPDMTFVADPVTAADTWSDQVAAFSQAFNY
jgi:hypothetical protein